MQFGKYSFQGPYDGARFLLQKQGVFIVLCKDVREDGKYYLIDIDESDDVRSAAMNHPRQVDWVKNCREVGQLTVGVFYSGIMKKEERVKVVSYIRGLYDVPCA